MSFKLHFFLLGSELPGRNTEQHDVFFTIEESLEGTLQAMKNFWPEAGDRLHIDCWREVTAVNGHRINVVPRDFASATSNDLSLFFINLGGYRPYEFEEYHYKELIVAKDKTEAIEISKETVFYKHTCFKGAESHIDDKFGIDVDDIYNIEEILPEEIKDKFAISITKADKLEEDELHIGYVTLAKLRKM